MGNANQTFTYPNIKNTFEQLLAEHQHNANAFAEHSQEGSSDANYCCEAEFELTFSFIFLIILSLLIRILLTLR